MTWEEFEERKQTMEDNSPTWSKPFVKGFFFIQRKILSINNRATGILKSWSRNLLGITRSEVDFVEKYRDQEYKIKKALEVIGLKGEDDLEILPLARILSRWPKEKSAILRTFTLEELQKLELFVTKNEEEILATLREDGQIKGLKSILDEIHAYFKNKRKSGSNWKNNKDDYKLHLTKANEIITRAVVTDSLTAEDFKEIVYHLYLYLKFKTIYGKREKPQNERS